jgi:quinol monooxygenase YgiN
MNRLFRIFLGALIAGSGVGMQARAQAPADSTRYAVTYVEVAPSARSMMTAALKQYREMSRKEDGYVRFDLLEQMGRPGHFAIVEAWRDQKAFDAHGMAAHVKMFRDRVQAIRLSDYDERQYKPLTVASASEGRGTAIHVVSHVDSVPQGDALGMLQRLAEASRKERGCLRFDVTQSTMRPNHFTVVETWESQQALDAHAAAAHTKRYRDEFQPISGSPLDERLYTAVD